MSSIATTLANSVECACCAANSMSLIKLRKLNAICIGCLSVLAIGSATFSAYFMYKIWKYQKKLAYLERKFDSLKLNITDDNTASEDETDEESQESLDDQLEDEETESSSTASEFVATVPISHKFNSTKTESVQIKSKVLNDRSRLVISPVSCDEIDVNYETPLGSPDRSYNFLNNIQIKKENKIESANFQQADDNKCLDLIISESYESLKQITSNRRKIYEDVNIQYSINTIF